MRFWEFSKPIQYKGGMNASELVNWFRIMTNELKAEISNTYEFESLIASDQTVVIGFFKDMESEPAKAYRQLVEVSLDEVRKWGKYGTAPFEFPFGITSKDAIFEAAGAQDGQVGIFKRFHKHREQTVFAKVENFNQSRWFIFKNSMPIVIDFSFKSAVRLLFSREVNYTLVLALNKTATNDFDTIAENYRRTAEQFRGTVRFMMFDNADPFGESYRGVFSFSQSTEPQMRMRLRGENFALFKPENESDFRPTVLTTFVQDVIDGKVERLYRNEFLEFLKYVFQ